MDLIRPSRGISMVYYGFMEKIGPSHGIFKV